MIDQKAEHRLSGVLAGVTAKTRMAMCSSHSWVSAVFPFKCAKNEAPVCLERSFFAVLIPVLPPKLDDAVFAVFSSVNSPVSGRGVANSAYPLYIRITATRFPHGFR